LFALAAAAALAAEIKRLRLLPCLAVALVEELRVPIDYIAPLT
jgi:hypothetical protein